ncbi:MAG TPA: AAA family ATPase [candidate division Zixibacteria bacterium]|nr:AAA family ATPase [candidate division Zixibacteria bacterium]
MLRTLHIKNLALIDDVLVTFGAGLNVITGESGAGKSLVMRALALALGARADKDDVGAAGDTCSVEAEFLTAATGALRAALTDSAEIPQRTKEITVTLRREISAAGRSRCFVNDQLTNLEALGVIADQLCRLQGQSSSVLLRSEERQLETLDDFAGLSADVVELGERFDQWEETRRSIERLTRNRERIEQERELLQFQIKELWTAELSVAEEERLITEKKRLDAADRLLAASAQVSEALGGDESPVESLAQLKKIFADIARADDTFKEYREMFETALIQLEETRRGVDEYRSSLFVDDERLNELNERLAEIYRLKIKYGGSVAAALERLAEFGARLENLPDTTRELKRLNEAAAAQRAAYTELALTVRSRRLVAGAALTASASQELADLAMPRNQFDFRFVWDEATDGIPVALDDREVRLRPERHGLERGQFFFSANPGEELKALARVASGGEMSRVLLALDVSVLSQNGATDTAPSVRGFDEVDSGVSGVTATAMGKKLKELSRKTQTLVVTHLPQVVSFADTHLLVEKKRSGGRNRVSVRVLSKSESRSEALKLADLAPTDF